MEGSLFGQEWGCFLPEGRPQNEQPNGDCTECSDEDGRCSDIFGGFGEWMKFRRCQINDGFEGGAAAFHDSRPRLMITPEQGKALVFYHRQLHEGMPVVKGRKYVLRTDVMYRLEPN